MRQQTRLTEPQRVGGGILVAHPENLPRRAWRQITMVHLAGGQRRPYADSVSTWEVTVEGGTPSTVDGFDLPWATRYREDSAMALAQTIDGWTYDGRTPELRKEIPWHAPRLTEFELVEQGDYWYTFRFSVTQPYLD
jgi:hypothetical protein